MWPSPNSEIRLLAYPGGKRFAFTIIDDTDMATLENVRPIYDYLFSLGLRTTKTVWAAQAPVPPSNPSDTGYTLEREEYLEYVRLLQSRGFEIALHNVSGQRSTRDRIAAGLEQFRRLLGDYPAINVHHEKNRENLYFEFAQRGVDRPPAFRTPVFRSLSKLASRNGHSHAYHSQGCSGEDSRSEYFWGDLCQEKVKYVRTNVFFEDLNTLKCNPLAPYRSSDTPYVNYWFDASNGKDPYCFNSILSDRNIAALKEECGCSILYTHFGMGFAIDNGGVFDLNAETKSRLRAVAGDLDGWYAPVIDVLARLHAFQKVAVFPLADGIAIANRNLVDIPSVTLCAPAQAAYCNLAAGDTIAADERGRMVLPSLPAATVVVLVRQEAARSLAPWHEGRENPWKLDLRHAARKVRTRWFGND